MTLRGDFADDSVAAALLPFGIAAAPDLAAAVRTYAELLLRWNARINLTAITRPRDVLERHFGESFFAAEAVPIPGGRLVDAGSGAGFPGLALKLVRPELHVTLLEPNQKKCAFLKEVCRGLNLRNVEVIAKRFEETKLPPGAADYLTARALGDHEKLLKWGRGVLAANGAAVLWLGAEDASAVAQIKGWSWRAPVVIPRSKSRVLLMGPPA